eukprot:Partr_v1_DN25033_c0_g1_i3_m50747 putative ubiquinone biosynthesis protein Coq7
MLAQEKNHRDFFNSVIGSNNIRPTVLTPLWHIAGWSLGAGTALLGRESAMMCTEAVETAIGEHYNDQLRTLGEIERRDGMPVDSLAALKSTITEFRNQELEHLDHAVANDSQRAPLHSALSKLIGVGCRGAIWISSRI